MIFSYFLNSKFSLSVGLKSIDTKISNNSNTINTIEAIIRGAETTWCKKNR